MNGECDKCAEHCTDCRCNKEYEDALHAIECDCEKCKEKWSKVQTPILNYFQMVHGMTEEVKIWAQMFFDDGSVTQGQYLPVYTLQDEKAIKSLALSILTDTCRTEGVIFIWGAGQVYARRCDLLLTRRGPFKGGQALRLRRL